MAASGQSVTVTAHVKSARSKRSVNNSVVVWLTPVGGAQPRPASQVVPTQHPRLTQRNKSFEPHLLVVPVGSVVEFPNRDPFFHNVFSLFEGKRFDLGLYEAGSTRYVHFDKPGVSYIFCNIHAEMSAVVIALATPYYGISNARGEIAIPHVPPGPYKLDVWYEAAGPDSPNTPSRNVQVSETASDLGAIDVRTTRVHLAHKNKYGRDYDPPVPDNPGYPQP
jgi:plastocyanin